MLRQGRDRLLDEGMVLPTVLCDAETLPFASGAFDLVSVAFGLRNMTHKDKALAEMARVLKTGGRLLVLEFSKVAAPLAKAYDWYSFKVLPRIGQLGRRRRRELSLPGRVDPRPSRPGGAQGDDEDGRLRPRRRAQPDRRRRRPARGDQVLSAPAASSARWRAAASRSASACTCCSAARRRPPPASSASGINGLTTGLGLVTALWTVVGMRRAARRRRGHRGAGGGVRARLQRGLDLAPAAGPGGVRGPPRAPPGAIVPRCRRLRHSRAGSTATQVLAAARGRFMRLQAAWDAADVSALRSLTTPEMLEELLHVLTERESRTSRTDVISLHAELLGLEELGAAYLASVEFSGLIRESAEAGPRCRSASCGCSPARRKTARRSWRLARQQALL